MSPEERTLIDNLVRRINQIVDPFVNVYSLITQNKTDFRIIMDAEQSYLQKAIFNLSEQYQIKFNKDKVYIIPTLQNYLVEAA
mgnify:CR=1 FL=1